GLDLSRVLWVRGPSLSATAVTRDWLVGPAILRAVRACDLIVRAGGFRVVALDLAGASARSLRDLASSTWMRLADANGVQATVFLAVDNQRMGGSTRGVSGTLVSSRCWSSKSPQSRRFSGFDIQADVQQSRRPVAPGSRWTLRAAG